MLFIYLFIISNSNNYFLLFNFSYLILGQQDDARMNLAIALTAARYGASVANHVSVTSLIKEKNKQGREVITGVNVKDEITGKTWKIPAKCVINATGPLTDSIRKMDDPTIKEICSPSSGVHITLPGRFISFLRVPYPKKKSES